MMAEEQNKNIFFLARAPVPRPFLGGPPLPRQRSARTRPPLRHPWPCEASGPAPQNRDKRA